MRKKNFGWLVDNLQNIEGNLNIDIYGPIEDKDYWVETQNSIKKLPTNIKIDYKGHIEHDKVLDKLFEYHFFILPTLGENFGHVFVEALSAGCPLIISDRTPWLQLEQKNIGWDIPLEEPEKWIDILNKCIKLEDVNYTKLSASAREFASEWLTNPGIEESTLTVLNYSLENNT
jgi:glycosyltransferase involved in cell wall biosynthesis